jgi:hypothetical protein
MYGINMANKTSIVVLMACLCLAGVFSVVIAASDNQGQQQQTNQTGQGLGSMNKTFMECVSDAAEVKNTCYSTTKETYASCKESSQNKQDTAKCKTDYKKSMKDCKAAFKAKRNECKVLKHNFFDSIRAFFM